MGEARTNQNIITDSVTGGLIFAWAESFIIDRQAQNLARGTVRNYRQKLSHFLKYCDNQVITRIIDVTPDTIRRYLLYLEESGHNPGGVHGFYRVLKSFFLWFESEAEPEGWKNPIRKVKAPRNPETQIEPVSMATVKALVKVCGATFHGMRDKALFYFLLDTGARASEACAVDLADVDQVSGAVLIRQGKGRKPRTVFLAQKARRALRAYLKRRTDHGPALWTDDQGQRLTYWGLREIVAAFPAAFPGWMGEGWGNSR